MTVYLLHFDRPISPGHTTQHYIGSTDSLNGRMGEHLSGRGARLTQVANERGIGYVVARVWRGGRTAERYLKSRKEGPRLCPICNDGAYNLRLSSYIIFQRGTESQTQEGEFEGC